MENVSERISEIFGSMVFNDEVMKKRLPKDVYESLHKTIESGRDLDLTIANCIAGAMKEWAMERGATHYTHWFQPMTGITAEKHDSFICPTSEGKAVMEFSGKELIKGESDASSFPSGGLRATFEARGYTAWDPTSYAFVKDGSLYIPTVFCSHSGEVLDKKTPLLRSMEAINKQALRILRLFGNTSVKRVNTTVGAEQEYFLVDKSLFDKRPDLFITGRTLFGANAPKGQQLDDHYYGSIKPRIMAFMRELDEELWKLGIFSKTKHNEVAPCQHELAPIYITTNIAVDQNHLTMEYMKKIAEKHGLVCLLHEKPFAGVNGSGKHNNWSLSTDTGINLLDPGKTPSENAQFLTFLVAVIKAVDEYQDLLRLSVATAGNDHRLGANEAPPAIVSMFIGERLMAVLDAIGGSKPADTTQGVVEMALGVGALPTIRKDTTDRNRTSPFAFTGNKFEFRMLGSSLNIAGPNFILNTIVAEELSKFADELESANDFKSELNALLRRSINEHRRIIFDGNGYSEEWQNEAARRGLSNYKSCADIYPHFTDAKNIALFEKHKIFTAEEVASRQEVLSEAYTKVIRIEAKTMLEMAKREYIPAISKYVGRLAKTVVAKKEAFEGLDCSTERILAEKLTELNTEAYNATQSLEKALELAEDYVDGKAESAFYYKEHVLSAMKALRDPIDKAERLTASEYWPYPVYRDLMFRV